MRVDAPFHGDPAPPGPPGRRPGLWEFEVVELFLVGSGGRYLELEVGPHGHFLALELEGIRRLSRDDVLPAWECRIAEGRWRGELRIGLDRLPVGVDRWNAFAIHGEGKERRYLAAHPLPGEAPDFHQPERFPTGMAAFLGPGESGG